MVTVINNRYTATEGFRAEVVSAAYGSCDLCGARCQESLQYDGWTDWSQATAVLIAKCVGWVERMNGRVQQLVCPACQSKINPVVTTISLDIV